MPVCITGMHRSGTSMVAKLLAETGVYLGPPADIMPAANQNPEGFWENLKFVELNDELLARLGGGWDLPPTRADWSAAAITALLPTGRELVTSLADQTPWGWKDPRTCLTMPFWQVVAPGVQTVVVVRNPLEVARSLRERNGFSYPMGLALWAAHYQTLLAQTPADSRIVTHYDCYGSRPDAEYDRIARWLGLTPLPAVVDQLRQERAQRLRHHRFNRQDLDAAGVQPAIRELYGTLLAAADWPDEAPPTNDRAPLADVLDPDLAAFDTLGLGLGAVSRLVVEANAQRNTVDRLAVEVERRDTHMGRLHTILQSQADAFSRVRITEQELAGARQTIQAQAATLIALRAELSAALAYETDLRAQLTAANEQLTFRDAEVMATLGIALASHSPQAPAAIYYRDLVRRVRVLVSTNVPAGAPVALAAWSDPDMLAIEGYETRSFPAPTGGISMQVTDSNDSIEAGLHALRADGVQHLVVPAAAWSWAARFHLLNPNSMSRLPVAADDDGVAVLYDLARWQPTPPSVDIGSVGHETLAASVAESSVRA